ncbi:hypothetical protein FSP39_007206 [Pinctada imbricata]|uniref:Uncharacterized protein n=1 Tax=Pinctada imbricata TaxID=66713 RepID=A0AA88XQF3_PINIB|nr:hypothetical protein FSP39_007206 [Pinctada imbricata]
MPIACNISHCGLNDEDVTNNLHIPLSKEKIKRWEFERNTEFLSNIDIDEVNKLVRSVSDVDVNDVEKNKMDSFFDDTAAILLKAAKSTFGTFTVRNNFKNDFQSKNRKKWFDKECYITRKEYRKYRRKYRKYGSIIFKNEMLIAQRVYKSTMDSCIKNYRDNLQKKIKMMRSSRPKDFWKLLNRKRNNSDADVDIRDFYEYFKNVNANDEPDDRGTSFDSFYNDENSEEIDILNERITIDEIVNTVRCIKNNKSAGPDDDFLLKLPGVTVKNYRTIMNKVNNLSELFSMTESELTELLGNSSLANQLYKAVHTKSNQDVKDKQTETKTKGGKGDYRKGTKRKR